MGEKTLLLNFSEEEENETSAETVKDQEETIRQLVEQIDISREQCVDFERQSSEVDRLNVELIKLKAELDDSSENCKLISETFDRLDSEYKHLQEALRIEQTQKQIDVEALRNEIAHKEQDVYYFRNELELNKNNLDLSNNLRCKAEDELRRVKWELLQKNHAIIELKESIILKTNDLEELNQKINEVNVRLNDAKRMNLGLMYFLQEFVPSKSIIFRRMMRNMCTKNEAITDNNDCNQLIPFTGDIETWNLTVIPFLGNFC